MKDRHRLETALLGVAFAALAGCATYHPRPLAPRAAAAAFARRRLDDPTLRRFIAARWPAAVRPWPPASWDFRLLMAAALHDQPALALARARWRTAEAGVIAAGARPNPRATPFAQRNLDPAGLSPWSLGLGIEIPIETAGRRDDRIAQAVARARAARQRLAVATWLVRSRLRRRLLALYRAREEEKILTQLEAPQTRYVALLERRTGDASSFELARSRAALDDTRLRIAAARRARAVARARVAEAIGLPARALDHVTLALGLFDHPALGAGALGRGLRGLALRARPDVLAALADYAAAEAALKLEVARQYPDLQLGPGYLWDEGQRKWSLTLGFALPFNHNRGPIAVARARRAQAAARFNALQDRIFGELDTTAADYDAALRELATAKRLLAADQARRRLLRRRLPPGALASEARLELTIAAAQGARARLDALVQAQQAFGALEDAVQVPLDPLEALP